MSEPLSNVFPEVFETLRLVYAKTELEPLVARFAQSSMNADAAVLLAEFCNFSAKIARETFKEQRAAKNPEAKSYDKASGSLMKAAKATILPVALNEGCTLLVTTDSEGQAAGLLRGKTHQIGLHGLSEAELEGRPQAKEEEKFTGYLRQWHAPATLESFLDGTSFANRVGEASRNKEAAACLQETMQALGYKGDTVKGMGKESLFSAYADLRENPILHTEGVTMKMPEVRPEPPAAKELRKG